LFHPHAGKSNQNEKKLLSPIRALNQVDLSLFRDPLSRRRRSLELHKMKGFLHVIIIHIIRRANSRNDTRKIFQLSSTSFSIDFAYANIVHVYKKK
jgi:hypothetical protein